MKALVLPETIPGRLRRGSPIVFESDTLGTLRGTVHQLFESDGMPMVSFAADGQEYTLQGAACDASLDLRDATGRAHAAWWLASKFVEEFPRVGFGGTPIASVGVLWHPEPMLPEPSWELATWNSNYRKTFCGPAGGCSFGEEIPALSDLDPDDPRTLEDGSRRVDAEALRLVCLHVAGLEVTP